MLFNYEFQYFYDLRLSVSFDRNHNLPKVDDEQWKGPLTKIAKYSWCRVLTLGLSRGVEAFPIVYPLKLGFMRGLYWACSPRCDGDCRLLSTEVSWCNQRFHPRVLSVVRLVYWMPQNIITKDMMEVVVTRYKVLEDTYETPMVLDMVIDYYYETSWLYA